MASVDRAAVDPAIKAVQTRKARYATFKITGAQDSTSQILVTLDKLSDRDATYKSFMKDLKDNAARFTIYDLEFKSPDGRPTSALWSISWMPENCNQKERILYSSAKNNFVSILNGFKQATCEEKDQVRELLSSESFIPATPPTV